MNWIDRVLADQYLSKPARHLAATIANRAAPHALYTAFYDSEVLNEVNNTTAQVRASRFELERTGYLTPLHHSTGRPSYSLRHGHAFADSDEVA